MSLIALGYTSALSLCFSGRASGYKVSKYKSDNHKCFFMEYVLHIFVARDHMQLQHSTLPIARTNRHNRPFSLYLNNAELSCRRAAAIDDTGHVTREFMGLKVCRGDLSTNTLTTTRRS